MHDITYRFKVQVKLPDGKIQYEEHKVSERATMIGDALATGRVIRYYEMLKKAGTIKEYRIIAE